MNEKLPGFIELFEPDNPGMHASDTIDCSMILSGEPILEPDDGETRRLAPGDTYVMRGTRHRWINPGDIPVVLVAVAIGAHRSQPHWLQGGEKLGHGAVGGLGDVSRCARESSQWVAAVPGVLFHPSDHLRVGRLTSSARMPPTKAAASPMTFHETESGPNNPASPA